MGSIKLHCWVHSHYLTGDPIEVSVFDIEGRVNIQWFYEALEKDNIQEDTAKYIYNQTGLLNTPIWIEIQPIWEDATDIPQAYFEIVKFIGVS